ncbi:hypothetical protein A3K71_01720 [archaeon RBG_16_50_20]|nr:MAG: hypothetical protein A3K71_01720 [archaeon RBG_16_50_20]
MEEVLNKGNMQAVDELIAPNFVEHNPFPGQAPGVEGLKQAMVALRQAFPDLHVTVDEMLSDGDKVVIRSTMKGTHKGNFMNIPATGKQMSVEGIDILRISNGRAVEHWGVTDNLTMMQQLGLVPAM